ncbi:MAG: hypothetical protein R3B13_27760 [Polyangiaceae bacterium]
MTTLGKNMKLSVDRAQRAATHEFFVSGLGAEAKSVLPELDVYVLDDGFNIGIYWVEAGEALSAEQAMKAPWLELVVEDVAAALTRLTELGGREFEYVDRTHHYLQAPGGLVFRLAKAP